MSFVPTKEHRAHSITCIDNEKGISLNTAGEERDEVYITFKDSFIYGQTRSLDCPPGGSECYCKSKYGFMSFMNMNDKKDLMPTSSSSLPIYKSHGEGNWGGTIEINNVRFENFQGKSACGERHVIFERNPNGSQKLPIHHFKSCKFENVDDMGYAWLEKPNPAWANIKDCGNFPCTAPNNWVLAFTGSRFYGVTPSNTAADFVLVPDDETVGGTYSPCQHKPDQQAYVCQMRNIGLLMFESLDEDAWDRAV